MEQMLAEQSLLAMVVQLIFMILTWWALQSLQMEKLFKKGKTVQIQLIYILVTIAVGSNVANFFLQYFYHAKNLPYLF